GRKLGEGMRLDEIISQMNMVAEGVKSSKAIVGLAHDSGVEMPIADGVVKVVHEGLAPQQMVKELMTREAKPEIYGMD
ncbi:MAG TPA: NAD(P)H-dependent glycerol-3-phosphate dehydrogenase, partial [Nitriliruptorales bacterium]